MSGEAGRRSKGVEGGEAAKADRVSWDTVNSSNYISDSLSYSYLVIIVIILALIVIVMNSWANDDCIECCNNNG